MMTHGSGAAMHPSASQPESERLKHLKILFFASTVLIRNAAHAIIVEQPDAVADAIVAWARKI
jgi:pimeloyl-ACP methyl ester carboxylesterase